MSITNFGIKHYCIGTWNRHFGALGIRRNRVPCCVIVTQSMNRYKWRNVDASASENCLESFKISRATKAALPLIKGIESFIGSTTYLNKKRDSEKRLGAIQDSNHRITTQFLSTTHYKENRYDQ